MPARSCARSPACATAGRTSARRSRPTSRTASSSGRTGSASIPRSTTTTRSRPCTEVVNGYPGLRRDVQTYLKERIREVLTGSSDAIVIRIYGEDLGTLRELAETIEGKLDVIAGIIDLHSEQLVNIPQVQVELDLAAAERHGVKPGDVRRIASAYMAGEEVGDVFVSGKAYDIQVWSVPEARCQPHRRPEPADRHRKRRQGGPQGHRERRHQALTWPHQPREDRPTHRRRSERRRPRPGFGDRGRQGRPREHPIPAGLPPRDARRIPGASERPRTSCCSSLSRHPSACSSSCRRVRQHTTRDPVVPDAAVGPRRRHPGRLARDRRHLARRVGRVLHGARHRGSERDHDDQPLPAPRARGGRGVRCEPRHPWRDGAARTDPHDGARDRPRARPAGDRRRSAGARDRAPDGDRDPRRARDLDAVEPVRRARLSTSASRSRSRRRPAAAAPA